MADPVFYTLPARLVVEGMSTADGQDVCTDAVATDNGFVMFDTCGPSDRDDTQGLIFSPDERVELAVFPDTDVDGSQLPEARVK